MSMNLPFPRPAEPPIKPQYIVLFKGDDSDFQGNQSVDVVIDTELDTTGMKAHFRFMDFVQDFNSIPENKTLSLVFPNAKTSEFPLGAADATLRFEDASGKFRTVSNRIHIVVTNSVHEAYDNEDSQSITVTMKGTVTWDMIEGKPDIPSEFPEPSDDKPLMDGEASAGESTEYSRGDHRHPSDTSKLDSAAAYPAWIGGASLLVCSYKGRLYKLNNAPLSPNMPPDVAPWWGQVYLKNLKQDALSPAQLAAVNSGATAAKVETWDGYAAQLAQKANMADLPYRLVEPGKWEFSGVPSGMTVDGIEFLSEGNWVLTVTIVGSGQDVSYSSGSQSDLMVEFSTVAGTVTATRASLPGHLLDRAVNTVPVTGDTTLALPALVNAGKARDLLVRLAISGSTVPTITFAAPTGETLTYETDGDEFPVPDETGDWLYSFTETAAHTFAVSLKKVNEVAQGGS